MTARICPVCGGEATRRGATYCSKSCAGKSRSAAFRGLTCTALGCDAPQRRNALCDKHDQRAKRCGGTVISADLPDEDRFWAKVAIGTPDECWPYKLRNHHGFGYGAFYTRDSGPRTKIYAHRFAYSTVAELIPGMEIMHLCDNPPCCNPAHLRQGTHAENMRDARAKGRMNLSGLALGRIASAERRAS